MSSNFPFTINPALKDYPDEVNLVGHMLLGYGELEFAFAHAAGIAADDRQIALHAATQVRSETSRLDIIDVIARRAFNPIGLLQDYGQAYSAIRFCLKVRNQWAHCHWGHDERGLIFKSFSNKDAFAAGADIIKWSRITLDTLRLQAAYFEYCRQCCLHLESNAPSCLAGRGRQLPPPSEMKQPHMQSQPQKPARIHRAQGQ